MPRHISLHGNTIIFAGYFFLRMLETNDFAPDDQPSYLACHARHVSIFRGTILPRISFSVALNTFQYIDVVYWTPVEASYKPGGGKKDPPVHLSECASDIATKNRSILAAVARHENYLQVEENSHGIYQVCGGLHILNTLNWFLLES